MSRLVGHQWVANVDARGRNGHSENNRNRNLHVNMRLRILGEFFSRASGKETPCLNSPPVGAESASQCHYQGGSTGNRVRPFDLALGVSPGWRMAVRTRAMLGVPWRFPRSGSAPRSRKYRLPSALLAGTA